MRGDARGGALEFRLGAGRVEGAGALGGFDGFDGFDGGAEVAVERETVVEEADQAPQGKGDLRPGGATTREARRSMPRAIPAPACSTGTGWLTNCADGVDDAALVHVAGSSAMRSAEPGVDETPSRRTMGSGQLDRRSL